MRDAAPPTEAREKHRLPEQGQLLGETGAIARGNQGGAKKPCTVHSTSEGVLFLRGF